MLPAEWLQTFETEEARWNYATTHLLGDVPEAVRGFDSFYEARRLQLGDKIVEFLD